MSRRHLLPAIFALSGLLAACSSPEGGGTGPDLNTSFAAQMASTWHFVGAPQRVQVGILASDANGLRVVTQGSLDIAFAALAGADPAPGPSVTATYV
ncbi:MAG: hypothetical protein ACRDG8_07890, partial [Actinomycetota bacterium]